MDLAGARPAQSRVCVSFGLGNCDSCWTLAHPREVTQDIGLVLISTLQGLKLTVYALLFFNF